MKLRRILFFVTAFLLSIFSFKSYTQQSAFSIQGEILDSISKKPLEFITIALKQNQQVVKTKLSAADGKFNIEKVNPGDYSLTILAIGYDPFNTVLNVKQTNINLGKIYLKSQVNNLNDVSVSASKPLISQEIDRIAYDIQADPESKSLSALDMMRKVPLLTLDAEDNIKLKGSGNYKILINGKPSGMMARDPKEILRSMSASSIKKIEVITTPPAKYDSEGLTGLINIITNSKIDNGYNANINTRYNFPVGGPGFGGYLTLKQGKFGASVYSGLGIHETPNGNTSNTRTTFGNNPSFLINEGVGKQKNLFSYGGAELSYELDSLNLITAEITPYGGYNKTTNDQNFQLTSPAINNAYRLFSTNKYDWGGLDLALNYQLGFKRHKEQMLTLSYKYTNSNEPQYINNTFSNRVNISDPNFKQENNSLSKEQTYQLDYVQPFKKLNVEAGLKTIIRDNNSDFNYQYFNEDLQDFEIDPNRSNLFNNKQVIIGAYNSYVYKLENWGFKAGVRLEETSVRANFITNSSNLKTSYFNLIPTVSINKKFKDMSNINLGFTQRIQRPGIYELNPFVDKSIPNFEVTGNPDLKAVLSNNFEISYSKYKKSSITVGLNYNFANNTIENASIYNELNGITYTAPANIGKFKEIASNLNINYPITSKWNANLNGNLGYKWIEGFVDGKIAKNDGLTGYAYLSSSYKFEKTWRLNASISFMAPQITLQGQSNAFVYTSIRGSKDLIKDKLTLSAGVNNPFSKFRNYNLTTEGYNFSRTIYRQIYNRSFSFSLNWKFGKLDGGIKKNQRSINNDDVKGSNKNTN